VAERANETVSPSAVPNYQGDAAAPGIVEDLGDKADVLVLHTDLFGADTGVVVAREGRGDVGVVDDVNIDRGADWYVDVN